MCTRTGAPDTAATMHVLQVAGVGTSDRVDGGALDELAVSAATKVLLDAGVTDVCGGCGVKKGEKGA